MVGRCDGAGVCVCACVCDGGKPMVDGWMDGNGLMMNDGMVAGGGGGRDCALNLNGVGGKVQ
jgi:hypothetical protein